MTHGMRLQRYGWLAPLAAGLLALLALALQLLPVAVALLLLASALLILILQMNALRPAVAPRSARSADFGSEAREQVTMVTPDGEFYTAQIVPLPQTDGSSMVLTAQGYQIVDRDGRVLYRLS